MSHCFWEPPRRSELTVSPTFPAGSGWYSHTADQPRKTGYYVTSPSGDRTLVTNCWCEPERGSNSLLRGIWINRSARTNSPSTGRRLLEGMKNEESIEILASHRVASFAKAKYGSWNAQHVDIRVQSTRVPCRGAGLTQHAVQVDLHRAPRGWTHPVERVLWAQSAAGVNCLDGRRSEFYHPLWYIHWLV